MHVIKAPACSMVRRTNGDRELVVVDGVGANHTVAQTMIFNFEANAWRIATSVNPDVRHKTEEAWNDHYTTRVVLALVLPLNLGFLAPKV